MGGRGVRLLALIPARGGSRRLPGKNLRLLGSRPLLAWSVAAARALPEVSTILVSTDDEAIASSAREAGASVPWLRPAELSGDEASTLDVALHALDWHEQEAGSVDGLLLLQPTSPFRRIERLAGAVRAFGADPSRAIVSFGPAPVHPAWCFRIEDGCAVPFLGPQYLGVRSQDLPPAHVVNGAFYLIAPSELRRHRTFFPVGVKPLLMDGPEESIDIDTASDWREAEDALAAGHPATVLPD